MHSCVVKLKVNAASEHMPVMLNVGGSEMSVIYKCSCNQTLKCSRVLYVTGQHGAATDRRPTVNKHDETGPRCEPGGSRPHRQSRNMKNEHFVTFHQVVMMKGFTLIIVKSPFTKHPEHLQPTCGLFLQ